MGAIHWRREPWLRSRLVIFVAWRVGLQCFSRMTFRRSNKSILLLRTIIFVFLARCWGPVRGLVGVLAFRGSLFLILDCRMIVLRSWLGFIVLILDNVFDLILWILFWWVLLKSRLHLKLGNIYFHIIQWWGLFIEYLWIELMTWHQTLSWYILSQEFGFVLN